MRSVGKLIIVARGPTTLMMRTYHEVRIRIVARRPDIIDDENIS
jgi:hypothetical protein